MTGKAGTDLSSVLPLDAQAVRIASGGGLVVSLREFPAKGTEGQNGYQVGFEPDELDFIAPRAAKNDIASSPTVPRPSVQTTPFSNSNPT